MRAWICRCLKYFIVNGTPVEQRVKIAFMFLGDVADLSYQGRLAKNEEFE